MSSKHARSPVVKLMVTLLLELITDHSREVITYNGYLTTHIYDNVILYWFGEKKICLGPVRDLNPGPLAP